MSRITLSYDDFLYENNPEQYFLMMDLLQNMESGDSDEWQSKYEMLEEMYKNRVDEEVREWAYGDLW